MQLDGYVNLENEQRNLPFIKWILIVLSIMHSANSLAFESAIKNQNVSIILINPQEPKDIIIGSRDISR